MTQHTRRCSVCKQRLNQLAFFHTVLLTDGRVDGACALGGAASSCRPLWGQQSTQTELIFL